MVKIPFIQYIISAFERLIKFDNKKNIEIKNIQNYINSVNNDYKKRYNESINIDFDIEKEVNSIVCNYPDIFYIDNDNIYIYDDIEELDICKLKGDTFNYQYFCASNDSIETFNILGIKEIFKIQDKLEKVGFELEKQIEEEYMKYPNSNKLRELLYKRFLFVLNAGINYKKYIEVFLSIPSDKAIPIDENFDYYNESEYIKNNEPYPIDNELYKKSEFYEDSSDALYPIQEIIDETYNYSIFGSLPLYKDKYNDYFTKLYMNDIFEDYKNNDFSDEYYDLDITDFEEFEDYNYDDKEVARFNFNCDDEEFVFYIIYLKKLTDLIAEGYIEFTKARNRLLYLLDNINKSLYISSNFERYYNESIEYESDEDSFENYEYLSKYFIIDAFEGKAGKAIEKLLFTSTYYDLTKDDEVIEILNRYKEFPQYEDFSKIILGCDKYKTKKLIK